MSRWPPVVAGVAALVLWQGAVWATGVPAYLVPGPVAIVQAFGAAPGVLLGSLASTLVVTLVALAVSTILGVGMAVAITASRWARAAIEPWAVALQVTPVVAIAPLIIAWVGDPFAALVVCAVIVAFFPIFSSTVTIRTSMDQAAPDHIFISSRKPRPRKRRQLAARADRQITNDDRIVVETRIDYHVVAVLNDYVRRAARHLARAPVSRVKPIAIFAPEDRPVLGA